jgi:hypothetical protein
MQTTKKAKPNKQINKHNSKNNNHGFFSPWATTSLQSKLFPSLYSRLNSYFFPFYFRFFSSFLLLSSLLPTPLPLSSFSRLAPPCTLKIYPSITTTTPLSLLLPLLIILFHRNYTPRERTIDNTDSLAFFPHLSFYSLNTLLTYNYAWIQARCSRLWWCRKVCIGESTINPSLPFLSPDISIGSYKEKHGPW